MFCSKPDAKLGRLMQDMIPECAAVLFRDKCLKLNELFSLTTTIAQDSFKAYFNHPSQTITGALVSTYIAGEAIGACFAAWSGDALGRKRTIAIAAGVATIGTVLQAAAVHIGMLICEPFLESIKREADMALIRLGRRKNSHWDGPHIVEFARMKEQIKLEKLKEVKSIFELWKRYRRRVLVSVAVQTCTSLSGVNVINYYQTILYAGVGVTGKTVLLLSGAYGTLGPIANLFSLWKVDTWGRTRSLFWGAVGLVVDLTLVMVLTRFFAGTTNTTGQGFVIAFIFCYPVIYYLGFNSVTWIYGAEVLPMHIRSKGNALAAFSHFIFNIAVNQAAPTAFARIGYKFYALFIALNLCTAVVVWAYFPETKGLSLEEIAVLFGDEVISDPHPSEEDLRLNATLDGIGNHSKPASTTYVERI
ncbi:hypothetical protein FRC07_013942 [Ceratobasidium sp. 392]|nr:hypothetical protein FRC07_013942 [Ceratobasidium sp. 392]